MEFWGREAQLLAETPWRGQASASGWWLVPLPGARCAAHRGPCIPSPSTATSIDRRLPSSLSLVRGSESVTAAAAQHSLARLSGCEGKQSTKPRSQEYQEANAVKVGRSLLAFFATSPLGDEMSERIRAVAAIIKVGGWGCRVACPVWSILS
jgi:hypothetical protein